MRSSRASREGICRNSREPVSGNSVLGFRSSARYSGGSAVLWHSAASPETPMVQTVVWLPARGKAGSKNQCKPLKIRGSPKRTKASAAGATPVFHEISRAAGPKQQTTKTDRLPHGAQRIKDSVAQALPVFVRRNVKLNS